MRTLLALLLAANVAVFTWAQGWLDPFLPAPGQAQREPARLANQINPGAVRVLPSNTTAVAGEGAGDARTALRCLEVGPFGLVDAAAAEAALESAGLGGATAGTWERDVRGPGQVWLRVPRADAALREKLQGLATSTIVLASGFKPCASAP